MPERVIPAARCLLYDPGAEGWAVEGGFDLYDIPAHRVAERSDGLGRSERVWAYTPSYRQVTTNDYEPSIHVIPERNVVAPAPRVVLKDTPTANWNFFGGEWENFRTPFPPRWDQLVQRRVQADYVWRAESKDLLPANPNLAFSIQRLDAPHNHNETAYPSYVEVIIGGEWSLRFSRTGSGGVWRRIGGQWRQLRRRTHSSRDALMVWFVVRRGTVCLSFDWGQTWDALAQDDYVAVPSGIISVEGVGCQVAFGLHQLAFDNCSYTTYPLPILEEHLTSPIPDLTNTLQPTGTDVRVVELPSPPATVTYRVLLAVATEAVAGLGWNFYHVPEVYAVALRWPTVLAAPIGGNVDLNSLGVVTEIDITEDPDLTGGARTGELKLLWDPEDAFSGTYGWRLMEIELGYLLDTGAFSLSDRCVMYVVQPEPRATADRESDIRFGLADLWVRATSTLADEGWMPLDGFTTVQARNYLLLKMGLPPSRGSWLATGAVLPTGPADEPRWWAPPGTPVSEIFAALDLYENTETFVAADGQWTNRVARYVAPTVTYVFDGEGADPTLRVREGQYRAEHRDVRTAVLAQGRDARGGAFWATSINYGLERAPAVSGFLGWRRWQRLDNLAVVSLEQALLVAAYRRAQLDDVPLYAEFSVPGAPDLYRGARLRVVNCEQLGLAGTEHLVAEGISSRWRPTKAETVSEIRARRIW